MGLFSIDKNIEVDEATGRALDGQSKICNWLYNHLLERANGLRAQYRETRDSATALTLYSKRGLRDLVPDLKADHTFLKSVYSSPLKNAGLRLSKAIRDYQASQHGKRPGPKVKWPKFRSWKTRWFSLEYDEPWKGYTLDGQTLQLKLGVDADGQRVSTLGRLAEPLPTRYAENVKTLRIVKEAGQFYAVFTVDMDARQPGKVKHPRVIALDPNHKNLAYGVGTDGRAIEIENMPGLKALDARIDLLKSRRDQCQRNSVKVVRPDGSVFYRPSRRWTFFNNRLQDAYRKRREQTKTFLNTVCHRLCRDYDVIGVGNYTPHGGGITRGMRRAMNNSSLIGRLKTTLDWTAAKSGKRYSEYDEAKTTRTCCDCGCKVEGGIALDIREWTCIECGAFHIRDENAAQNGLPRVLKQNHLPRSGHTPEVKVLARWAWRVTPSGVVATLRGRDGSALDTTDSEHRQEIKPEA